MSNQASRITISAEEYAALLAAANQNKPQEVVPVQESWGVIPSCKELKKPDEGFFENITWKDVAYTTAGVAVVGCAGYFIYKHFFDTEE